MPTTVLQNSLQSIFQENTIGYFIAEADTTEEPYSSSIQPVYRPRTYHSSEPLPPGYRPEDLPDSITGEDRARLTESHFCERIPPTAAKKHPSRRCKVCLARRGYTPGGQRKYPKETTYHCGKCPSKPALCTHPCFWLYHNKVKYDGPIDDEEMQQIPPMLQNVPLSLTDMSTGQGMSSASSFVSVADSGSSYGDYTTNYGAGSSGGFSHDGRGANVFASPNNGSQGDGDVQSMEDVKVYPMPMYGETTYPERR
ncbi:hypothetical protein BaRGS_00035411 [Batillaria attramentaria]|uniref:PiggyBac transposable element-derived protein 4 C-terminal zinc-finger domain-containing protein n=1 Tax=Batillaria attramentaria TaxID=370345 RepID=A0ABD0JEK1_9CAEN